LFYFLEYNSIFWGNIIIKKAYQQQGNIKHLVSSYVRVMGVGSGRGGALVRSEFTVLMACGKKLYSLSSLCSHSVTAEALCLTAEVDTGFHMRLYLLYITSY